MKWVILVYIFLARSELWKGVIVKCFVSIKLGVCTEINFLLLLPFRKTPVFHNEIFIFFLQKKKHKKQKNKGKHKNKKSEKDSSSDTADSSDSLSDIDNTGLSPKELLRR